MPPGGDVGTAAVEGLHRDGEAGARLAEPVGHGHADLVEHHLPGGLGVPAHLPLERAEAQAGRTRGHDDRADAVRPRTTGAGHDDVDGRAAGPGDELLGPGEDVLLPVPTGGGGQRGGVGPDTGFGEAVGPEVLHRREPRQPARPLLLVAVGVDHPGDHVVDGDVGGQRRVAVPELLEECDGVAAGQPRAADVLPDVHGPQAHLPRRAEGLQREVLLRVPLVRVGRQCARGEVTDRRDEGDLLLRHRQVDGPGHAALPPSGRPGPIL